MSRPKDLLSRRKSKEGSLDDILKFSISAFTVTFAVEVVGYNVWNDCNVGWVDLEPADKGIVLSYQLYPGQNFEVNIVIWPQVAKVFCGSNYGWVRTWQFLERRWLAFTIRHAFPMKVMELRDFMATVTPMNSSPKGVYVNEVYLPPLQFNERRQFAHVEEGTKPINQYFEIMLWSLVVVVIPASVYDDPFNIPQRVKDTRHQDSILHQIRDVILNPRGVVVEEEEEPIPDVNPGKSAASKHVKPTKTVVDKNKHEIKLPGDWILAGNGRVTPFITSGICPKDIGEVFVSISSVNLPAHNDLPTFFVNVCNLTEVPVENLKKNGFTHIYTSWTIGEEIHNSERLSLEKDAPKTEVNFEDHHSVPLSNTVASDVMASFLDKPFRIELRGIRIAPPLFKEMKYFGYEKTDDNKKPLPKSSQDVDVLIAHARIDARALIKINGFIKGEYPLYPPETSVVSLNRAGHCTNDINSIRAKVKPDLFVQPSVILEAQMMIEVSMGIVGCKPKSNAERYSRLHCLISDREAIMALLCQISEINESAMQIENKSGLLTGFALDTGDTVLLFVEGPKEGNILQVWERTEDFYPTVKPVFSTSAMYNSRLYHDFELSKTPFNVMKMYAPLNVLLSLVPVYVRPVLPLPARSALLKIGRLIAGKFKSAPCCLEMPTALELMSFRLELCGAPRPVFVLETPKTPSVGAWAQREPTEQNVTRVINWKQEEET